MSQAKRILIVGGVFSLVAFSLYCYYKHRRSLRYMSITLLDKTSLLQILQEISLAYSDKFSLIQQLNRKKRRKLTRTGADYACAVRELKEKAQSVLEKATQEVLLRRSITEEVYVNSFKYFEYDSEVVNAVTNLCTVRNSPTKPVISKRITESALRMYTEMTESLGDENLDVKMKVIEDEIYEKLHVESEEVELALKKYGVALSEYIEQVADSNDLILEKADALVC